MSWVLWDIITPLLLTFALGLTMGWLLWRWRREQVSADASEKTADASDSDSSETSSTEKMESINAVLIAERDEAVERASAAEESLSEAQVEILKLKTELPVTDDAEAGAVEVTEGSISDEDIDNSEKFQDLVTLLAKEQEQRAGIELELGEANDRYEFLERELAKVKDEAVDETRLVTLQEDLDLSHKVIEEKDQQYLDSVLEMEKLIEDRDERIATLEATLADVETASADSDKVPDDLQSDEVSASVEAPAETETAEEKPEQPADEEVGDAVEDKRKPDAEDSAVTKPADGISTGETLEDEAVPLTTADNPASARTADSAVNVSAQQTGSSRQSEALISQATAAEIAVALAEEFDIDTDDDPQAVVAPAQTTSSNSDSARSANETMASVSVKGGLAANEDAAPPEQTEAAGSNPEVSMPVHDTDSNLTDDASASEANTEEHISEDDGKTTEATEVEIHDALVKEGVADEVPAEDEVSADAEVSAEKDESAEMVDGEGLVADTVDNAEADSNVTEDAIPPVEAGSEAALNNEESDSESIADLTASQESISDVSEDDDSQTGASPEENQGSEQATQTNDDSLQDAIDLDSTEQMDDEAEEVEAEAMSALETDTDAPHSNTASLSAEKDVEDKDLLSADEKAETIVESDLADSEDPSVTDSANQPASGRKKSVAAKTRKTGAADSADKAAKKAATKKKATRKKKSNANGYAPTAWDVPARAPAEKNRDQLTDIKGVGPVLEGLLHDSGIYYFKQVALLDKDGIDELQEQIPQFPGRIRRDKWVSQAKSLHRKKYGSAAKHS